MNRLNNRENNETRPIRITTGFTKHAEGSVLIEMGDTKVICTASVEEKVPSFMKGTGKGWVTGEYGMLPRSTETRKPRDTGKKVDGRSVEIQRLIGRSLRSIVDLEALGEISVYVDCDVIQADGGTRTASITGSFVALALAFKKLLDEGKISKIPLNSFLAAVSVGISGGEVILDLDYPEDSGCHVDMNLVMTESGELVEIQGTGEEKPFSRKELNEMLEIGEKGIRDLIRAQKIALGEELVSLIIKNENTAGDQ